MRNFNHEQTFESMKKSASDAVKTLFPVEGRTRRIELSRVWVEDNIGPSDYKAQAKVKQRSGTYGVPVYAGMKLVDKATGKVIDENNKIRLFMLPKMTDRLSYIVKGGEYQVKNQLRLKSGAYTSRREDGSLKSQINLSVGKNFELDFNEATGKFIIVKVGGGQAKIPLYPILTELGMSHQAISQEWGEKIAAANKVSDPKITENARTAFGTKKSLKEYFSATKIDKDTTKSILGEGFSKVDGRLLAKAAKNLLEVHTGKKEPQDREALEFKSLWGVEDYIQERLEKNQYTLKTKLSRGIDNPKRTKLTQLVNPNAFNSTIETFFTTDERSANSEQTNPLSMLSEAYKATITGPGGISNEHMITDAMRSVHPTHYGFLDPVHTPESDKIGAQMTLPLGVVKDGKEIKKVVKDKNGKPVTITPAQAFDSILGFPNQTGNIVKAQHRGKVIKVAKSKVEYWTPHASALFAWNANLIPFLPSNQANRAMMASKQMEQAISLKHREAPLVQTRSTGTGRSYEDIVGHGSAITSPVDGKITAVNKDYISVRSGNQTTKVNVYDNFTLNRETFIHNTPVVKVGDMVKKGQLLADNNYTKDGVLALGTNLKAAYLPYKGLNFEDGIVITDSAAEKLTSEHIRKKTLSVDANVTLKLSAFTAHYPSNIKAENRAKLDEDGIIKKGSRVSLGDTVIAALRSRDPSKNIALLNKALSNRPKDISEYWKYEDDGIVTEVVKAKDKITVHIKTEDSAKIGDKLTGRMGNKGIVTKIIPDDQAPKDKDGNAIDILLNPHGVIGRINIGQIYESATGKAAKKMGKPILVENFTGENYLDNATKHLKDAGLEDKEELFDGESGKSLGKVHVGQPHILKLYKQSTSNYSARQGGAGHGYDKLGQPLKPGGEDSAKALDVLGMHSMLSHGARHNLREMATTKADRNDDYWRALKEGQPLPTPKSTVAYDHFINYMKGAGVNTDKKGSKITLAPLTDDELTKMTTNEVTKVAFHRSKDMKPIQDGFFDQAKFGGVAGDKWGYLKLKEPVINPVFEGAAKAVLGMGGEFNKVLDGKIHINKDGKLNTNGDGLTGANAIEGLLKKVDVEEQMNILLEQAKGAKEAKLDSINKKLRYLQALKKADLRPEKAYMRKKLPVVPPKYRPIYPLPDGNLVTSDINLLYQQVGLVNEMMQKPVMDLLPESEKQDIRQELRKSVQGVSGMTDYNLKGRDREGFIHTISGKIKGSPKKGMFISKLMSKKQDFVGRGTIIPEPDLGVDEAAIPEEMAWKLFEPFVIRQLRQYGKTPLQGKEEIKNKTILAKRALELVMNDRKILLNRAPSLHKFSMMAFKPKITSGKAIKIPPLVVDGFNADFDGDTMTVHVPISNEANEEAGNMLPSKNLFKPGTGELMLKPAHEAQTGIYYLSKSKEGLKTLNEILGPKYGVKDVLDKGKTKTLMMRLSKELSSDEFASKLFKLKSAGEKEVFDRGFTLGLDDLRVDHKKRDMIVNEVEKQITKGLSEKDMVTINSTSQKLMDSLIKSKLKDKNNPLYDMVESGGRGDNSQLRSIMGSPLFVEDPLNKIVRFPIKKSYSEGLDIADYWTSVYGARKGMIDKVVQTSEPGAFAKDIVSATLDNVISKDDCGVKEGAQFAINSKELLGRFLARNQLGFSRNLELTSEVLSQMKKKGAVVVEARSPLKCLQPKGMCAMCYGIDEHGKAPNVGENVGVKAAQTVSEPLTQAIMKTFHTGGVAGTGQDAEGYTRIHQLLHLAPKIPGSAPLSLTKGKVTKIAKGLIGGYDVFVDDNKYHVPKGKDLKVKVGSSVEKGDPLSTGSIKPQDLVKLKGMSAAQNYIVDELKRAYDGQGSGVDRRTIETIVRSTGNTTKVLNNPKGSGFLPGDVVPYTVVNYHNKNLNAKMEVGDAAGETLLKDIGGIRAGTKLTNQQVAALERAGVEEVSVKKEAIVHAPFLKGVQAIPILRQDWMAALGYQNLAKAIREGAGQGWSTDTAGYHPIPAFVHGATFGKGKDGKY